MLVSYDRDQINYKLKITETKLIATKIVRTKLTLTLKYRDKNCIFFKNKKEPEEVLRFVTKDYKHCLLS